MEVVDSTMRPHRCIRVQASGPAIAARRRKSDDEDDENDDSESESLELTTSHLRKRGGAHGAPRPSLDTWFEARKARTAVGLDDTTTTNRLQVTKAGVTMLINRTYIVIKHLGSGTYGQKAIRHQVPAQTRLSGSNGNQPVKVQCTAVKAHQQVHCQQLIRSECVMYCCAWSTAGAGVSNVIAAASAASQPCKPMPCLDQCQVPMQQQRA
ncbi:uncharacterized protein HaLaN_00130 [Haematococcus lacustris]|uniref:Uncharacterized protein n=1 Tax=Haematococcus lacustris TaxID=44745 RepID=A0A699Y8M9_HAELA|nr:uncharacterized protein HaLaN_00130 [Haematococcus lacustris]